MLLYKYRGLSTEEQCRYAEDIIVNRHLYFAIPATFNDPFEYRFVMSYEGYGEVTEKQQYAARNLFYHLRESVGVLSLSAERDNILLWSHYADSHRGICIEFDTDVSSSFLDEAKPVTYQLDFPDLNIFTTTKEEIERLFLTKSSHWAYEQEWRVVDRKNGGKRLNFEAPLLKSIIVGCEISHDNRDRVLSWVGQLSKPIPIYQANISSGRFGLDILPFSHD